MYTTIDSGLQTYLETLMDSVNSTYQPTGLNAVLMDAKTGAIWLPVNGPHLIPIPVSDWITCGVIRSLKMPMNQVRS